MGRRSTLQSAYLPLQILYSIDVGVHLPNVPLLSRPQQPHTLHPLLLKSEDREVLAAAPGLLQDLPPDVQPHDAALVAKLASRQAGIASGACSQIQYSIIWPNPHISYDPTDEKRVCAAGDEVHQQVIVASLSARGLYLGDVTVERAIN